MGGAGAGGCLCEGGHLIIDGKLFSAVCDVPAELLLCALHWKSEFIFRGPPLLTMEMMAVVGGGQSPEAGTEAFWM